MTKLKMDISRLALVAAFLLASALSSTAQADEAFLWSVKGKKNTVYLLGSMHMLPPSAFPLPASMNRAYSNSDIVVFETDIGSVNKPNNQKVLLQAGTLPKGETLSNILPGDQLRDLVDIAEELRLPIEVLNGYRPWLAALTLELSAYMKQGFQPDMGVDQHYYERAQKDNKKVVTLETVRAQTNLFTDMSDAMSNDYMAMTLYHMEDPEDLPEDILEIWQDGDVGDMEDYVEDAQDDYPRMYNRFLRDRNRNWMPTVLDLLKQDENALIIVGALHMVGDEGLVELLRKAGYSPIQKQ